MGAVKNLAIDLAYGFEMMYGREPSYAELDEMFKMLVEHRLSVQDAVKAMAEYPQE